MRYNTYLDCDVVNAIGVSCSLFFQGCSHHCKNCFNPETWGFDEGKEFDEKAQQEFIDACRKPYITSIAILGGDPLQQPIEELKSFLRALQKLEKPILLWTGYRFYEIVHSEEMRSILPYVDYIVDGEYEESLRDTTLKLRGSRNQNIWKRDKNIFRNTTNAKRSDEVYEL